MRLDLDTVWNKSSSFDIVSDRDTSLFPGISVGYVVLRSGRLSLVPELGFAGNDTTGSALFGGAVSKTSLTTLNPYAGLGARCALLSILDAGARVSGGPSLVGFEMETADGGTLSDDRVAPFLTVGGGFTLHTWAGALETRSGALRSLIAGLAVESGYLFAGSVDLTPTPSASTGRIATTYTSLGRLERSGPYLKVSLTARF